MLLGACIIDGKIKPAVSFSVGKGEAALIVVSASAQKNPPGMTVRLYERIVNETSNTIASGA